MNILAIGAHPDDIEYACGGTLLKMKAQGHSIFMMVMTKGDFGGDAAQREIEQRAVAEALGITKFFWGEEEDTKIPVNNSVINKIDAAIKECKADLVMFNHLEDTHQDHRALGKCAMAASRHMSRVLTFEVPTSVNFQPDIFVDIGDVIENKDHLLQLHASQVDKTNVPHLMITENARACAVFRGFQGRVKFAEGFKSVRFRIDNL